MRQLRIVKVGGSLLDWPQLGSQLRMWLADQQAQRSVLVAGGGDLTDAIRRAQAIHRFDDQEAHWMCVRALSVTALALSRLLPDAKLTSSLDEGPLAVFDPSAWAEHIEPRAPGAALPHDWTATTDSIAARLASLTAAGELVLLKSADPPAANSLADLAAAGYVDPHFPAAASGLPLVRLVNLRGEGSREAIFRC